MTEIQPQTTLMAVLFTAAGAIIVEIIRSVIKTKGSKSDAEGEFRNDLAAEVKELRSQLHQSIRDSDVMRKAYYDAYSRLKRYEATYGNIDDSGKILKL